MRISAVSSRFLRRRIWISRGHRINSAMSAEMSSTTASGGLSSCWLKRIPTFLNCFLCRTIAFARLRPKCKSSWQTGIYSSPNSVQIRTRAMRCLKSRRQKVRTNGSIIRNQQPHRIKKIFASSFRGRRMFRSIPPDQCHCERLAGH